MPWLTWALRLQEAILRLLEVRTYLVKMMRRGNEKLIGAGGAGELESLAKVLPNLKCLLIVQSWQKRPVVRLKEIIVTAKSGTAPQN